MRPEDRLQTRAFVYLRKALDMTKSTVYCVEYPRVTTNQKLLFHMRGVRSGVSDLFILSDGISLAVELKVRPNRVKDGDNQHMFGQAIIRAGGHWIEATTVQEIVDECARLHIFLSPLVAVPGFEDRAELASVKAARPKRKAAPMREKAQQDQITKWNASQARIGELFKARGKA